MISELTGEYRFLSNFWSCFISLPDEVVDYPSVENAYQAAKCRNKEDRKKFVTCKASEAKRLGQVVELFPNWESLKLNIMTDLVLQKFERHPDLAARLLKTEGQEIQEGNWWGDRYWGVVNGVGENHLGKILMHVRAQLLNCY